MIEKEYVERRIKYWSILLEKLLKDGEEEDSSFVSDIINSYQEIIIVLESLEESRESDAEKETEELD